MRRKRADFCHRWRLQDRGVALLRRKRCGCQRAMPLPCFYGQRHIALYCSLGRHHIAFAGREKEIFFKAVLAGIEVVIAAMHCE